MIKYVFIGLGILAIIAAIYFGSKSGGGSSTSPIRKGWFGYYGSKGNQVAETADHTNVHWEAFWDDEQGAIENLRKVDGHVVLDVGRIFERVGPKNLALRKNAEFLLRDLFDKLREAGVLDKVDATVVHDEPNLPENQIIDELPLAVGLVRSVASEYPELSGLLQCCIYYSHTPMIHMELFDLVAFDEYGAGADIFRVGGSYDVFRSKLKPGQRTLLIPGGSYGQDPKAFVTAARYYPECLGIIAFLWREPGHGSGAESICNLPIRDAYVAAGKELLGRT